MPKSIRFLLFLCIAAMAGVMAVQFYWISSYYTVTKNNFERDVNLAFEDAIKKEFSLRNDTIETLLVKQLLDTSVFTITSRWNLKNNLELFTITNTRNKKDLTDFSHADLDKKLVAGDTAYKRTVALHFAHALRSEDLENHVVYYRTQNLGGFELKKVEQYSFDTARLRPVLSSYLVRRNIQTPFQFYLRRQDSTLNSNQFPAALLDSFPVITKSFPTYKRANDTEQYVRALFSNPSGYIALQMRWLFISTIALIALVACCIYLLLKTLYQEKKLSIIKNDFIDNITHEFKTPIATVSAAIEAMSDFDVLKDEQKTARYLQHSRTELNRLNVLVNNVLNLSIYEKGRVDVQPEELKIEEAIRNMMDSILLTTRKPVQFFFQNNSSYLTILTDSNHFHQAINNVLDNAIKYSNEEVIITITCYEQKKHFIVSINDNGIGISSRELAFVFDRFYRATVTGHVIKGHGLGLNYVKSIMEAQGGWVKMESTKGKGSSVKLAWPIWINSPYYLLRMR